MSVANVSLAASNADNGNTITSDEAYFFWGNDDGSLTFSETGAPTNRQILGRTWLIEESGSGTIEISVPDNSSAAATTLPDEESTIYLLADTDNDFSSGATEIVMTLNGTEWEATNNLAAYNYFTFATEVPPAPGGVTTIPTFWFRADQEVYENGAGTDPAEDGDNAAVWGDVSGNGNDAFDVNTDPDWVEVAYSYNPSVDYSVIGSGNAGGHSIADAAAINTGSSTQKSIAIAFRTGSDITGHQVLLDNGSSTENIAIYIYDGDLYVDMVDNNADNAASTPITANTAYVFTFIYDGGSTDWNAYLNGSTTFGDNTAPPNYAGSTDDIGIGRVDGNIQYHNDGFENAADPFLGEIMEFMYFDSKVFTQNEREALAGYLAMKYGITLDIDYEASNNSPTPWDVSANTGYNNDITTIGRDDESGLNQKQGLSASTDRLVSMGITALASSNASNANSFSADEQFIVWGNDDGSNTFSTTGAPTNRMILGRTWKMQFTGTPGNVEISVPDNSSGASTTLPAEESTIYLLLDTDADFSTGATEVAMTLNGTEWEATTSISSYTYFTFATQVPPLPGGISGVPTFWLKADEEVYENGAGDNPAEDGDNAAVWGDVSGNGNDAFDVSTDPDWVEVAYSYNPSVDYSVIGSGGTGGT